MYGASKHAVTALAEALRKELEERQSKIRVTVSTQDTDANCEASRWMSDTIRHRNLITHQAATTII
jgi:short-subunit dehydrogenase